ncbi:uncharacterized protein BJ171DRAFT_63243 [Polychytrium aggregatum]|uniref:uncharacterized protein n=1 Tax=Polychytrium aggregatum TaxID=110093 RepID=UPI0022FF2F84|nr:uncharacterized protein BJ171DRAFT_63243 [Polychytrium aggregatum]KAI9205595.1 hypothetical protein BJ171DRAFT_63243 [Polychytrium aggregatum]
MDICTPEYPVDSVRVRDGISWVTSVTCECPFAPEHFWTVIDLWTAEPQYVIVHILRAEILSEQIESEHPVLKRIRRRLMPKRAKIDIPMVQDVVSLEDPEGVCWAEHIPVFDGPWEEQDLPYFCPKVRKFAYVLEPGSEDDGRSGRLSVCIVPFEHDDAPLANVKMQRVWTVLLKALFKFMRGTAAGYEKRVHHDVIAPKIAFQDKYQCLKDKYIGWVDKWPEETDPRKHVFEDVAIAAWLIVIWENEQQELGLQRKQTFVDVGCGNGLLVHILTEEGYSGHGIDMASRKLWKMFDAKTKLTAQVIHPKETTYPGVDWIIGNHPDELTLWIPIFAARSGYDTRFVIIPCCFHELSGIRFTHTDISKGRYHSYLEHVVDFCERVCGYIPEKEHLRIPSTKNVAIIGRKRTFGIDESAPECQSPDDYHRLILERIDAEVSAVALVLRKTDQEKEQLRREREAAKRAQAGSIQAPSDDGESAEMLMEEFGGMSL